MRECLEGYARTLRAREIPAPAVLDRRLLEDLDRRARSRSTTPDRDARARSPSLGARSAQSAGAGAAPPRAEALSAPPQEASATPGPWAAPGPGAPPGLGAPELGAGSAYGSASPHAPEAGAPGPAVWPTGPLPLSGGDPLGRTYPPTPDAWGGRSPAWH